MATAMKSQTKTGFVKEFLSAHPEANTRAVNEAWRAAGYKDGIGDSLIYHLKSEMRKGANRRGNTVAADAVSGKAAFSSAIPKNQPEGAVRNVNDASKAAGVKGESGTARSSKAKVSRKRTGAVRGKPPATTAGTARGAHSNHTAAAVAGIPAASSRGANGDRTSALLNIEAEIDQLLFSVMGIGDLAEIEIALRSARRKLYGVMGS